MNKAYNPMTNMLEASKKPITKDGGPEKQSYVNVGNKYYGNKIHLDETIKRTGKRIMFKKNGKIIVATCYIKKIGKNNAPSSYANIEDIAYECPDQKSANQAWKDLGQYTN